MKKYFSKVLALIIVIVMICACAVTAFAGTTFDPSTDKGSITFGKFDVNGITYSLYRVASVEPKLVEGKYQLTYTDLSGSSTPIDYNNETAQNILSKLDNLATLPAAATTFTTSKTESKTCSNLDLGAYYVKATNKGPNVTLAKSMLVYVPVIDNDSVELTYNVTVTNKTSEGTTVSSKVIVGANPDYTEAAIGEKIPFKLSNGIAGSASNVLKRYQIVDTASKGLTLPAASATNYVVKGDKTGNFTYNTDYTVTVNNGSLTVAFKDTALAKAAFYTNTEITVEYSAELNSNAEIGATGNTNKSHLEYSNSPTGDMSTTPDDTVYVYTFALELSKVAGDSKQALAGAKFTLYSSDKSTVVAADKVTNASGKIDFNGLKAGTYYLLETEAPTGYQVYGDYIKVQLTATYKDAISNNTWVSNTNASPYTVTVVDPKVPLPVTGGNGILLFTIGGILLMGAAVVIFIISRRKSTSK